MRVHDCLMVAMKCFEALWLNTLDLSQLGHFGMHLAVQNQRLSLDTSARMHSKHSPYLTFSTQVPKITMWCCVRISREFEILRFSKILEDSQSPKNPERIKKASCVLVSGCGPSSLGDWPSFKVSPPMSHTICLALTPALRQLDNVWFDLKSKAFAEKISKVTLSKDIDCLRQRIDFDQLNFHLFLFFHTLFE